MKINYKQVEMMMFHHKGAKISMYANMRRLTASDANQLCELNNSITDIEFMDTHEIDNLIDVLIDIKYMITGRLDSWKRTN